MSLESELERDYYYFLNLPNPSEIMTPEEIEEYNNVLKECADCHTTIEVGYSRYYKVHLCLSCAESRGV